MQIAKGYQGGQQETGRDLHESIEEPRIRHVLVWVTLWQPLCWLGFVKTFPEESDKLPPRDHQNLK